MTRREALSMVAWITGGIVAGADLLLSGCTAKPAGIVGDLFEPDMTELMGDMADTILPPTSSPGAKEAGVGPFIPVMVRDCYTPEDQEIFLKGINQFREACMEKYQRKFSALSAAEKKELIIFYDKEMKAYNARKKEGMPNHFFDLFRQLTLLGYFTSEKGATMALRYVQIPGRYDGNLPYKKGDKAWAV